MGIRIDKETIYHQLGGEQVRKERKYIVVVKNGRVAKHILKQWITENKLGYNYCSIEESDSTCFAYKKVQCKGACIEEENPHDYNQRVAQLANKSDYPHNHFLLIGKGRKNGESSFIYIQDQVYRGYGFFDLNYQIKTPEKILSRIISMDDNSDCRALILSFIKREKYLKLIPLVNTSVG